MQGRVRSWDGTSWTPQSGTKDRARSLADSRSSGRRGAEPGASGPNGRVATPHRSKSGNVSIGD